jgi:hypothetical protein
MAWWAEPRNRERSSGRGPEAPGRRAAAAAAQGQALKGVITRGSSGNFIGGFWSHLQPGNRREGLHRLGASLLNGLVSRGHSRPSYVKFTRLGRGRLGYPR